MYWNRNWTEVNEVQKLLKVCEKMTVPCSISGCPAGLGRSVGGAPCRPCPEGTYSEAGMALDGRKDFSGLDWKWAANIGNKCKHIQKVKSNLQACRACWLGIFWSRVKLKDIWYLPKICQTWQICLDPGRRISGLHQVCSRILERSAWFWCQVGLRALPLRHLEQPGPQSAAYMFS